ncbi:MAG: hypothetical protein AB1403_23860, partial [Candidatus Riflebacteria bacterium]
MVKKLSLLILLILIAFSGSAEIQEKDKKSRVIEPDQLNKLRAVARNRNFKTPQRQRIISRVEISSLLSSNPSHEALESARKFQFESHSYIFEIE